MDTETGNENIVQTSGPISDYFSIESEVFTLPCSRAFRASNKTKSGESVVIVISNGSFASNKASISHFLRRLQELDQIDPPLSPLLAFGVDSDGLAFSVFAPPNGFPVSNGNFDASEGERRFLGCLRVLNKLHDHDLALGDVGEGSFWLTRETGDISLYAVNGVFAEFERSQSTLFLAPELLAGGSATKTSDVFSAGVLGLTLLSKRPLTQGDLSPARVAELEIPRWAQLVFPRCLEPSPDRRIQDVSALIAEIQKAREQGYAEESVPMKRNVGGVVKREGGAYPEATEYNPPTLSGTRGNSAPVGSGLSRSFRVLMSLLVVLFVGIGAVVWILFGSGSNDESRALNQRIKEFGEMVSDSGVQDAVTKLSQSESSLLEKKREYDKITSSDDPVAHQILIQAALDAETQEEKVLAEEALLERGRRFGFTRSAEQIKQWLRYARRTEVSERDYSSVLRLVDPALPIEERINTLLQMYPQSKDYMLRIATALALDTDDLSAYQGPISKMVGDSLELSDASNYSTAALVLAHPELSLVFSEDIIQQKETIADKDILWVLDQLAARNDVNMRAVANLAVERNVLSENRKALLVYLRDRASLPADVLDSVVKAASGALEPSDISAFGRWYDTDAEKILLLIASDPEYAKEGTETSEMTFDILAGKSLFVEPSKSLVEWIRRDAWDRRASLTRLVGVLGTTDLWSNDEILRVIKANSDLVKRPQVLSVLLESEQPGIIASLVREYGSSLSLGDLLELLSFSDKSVRASAIKALSGTNDIGALKLIIDAYEDEKDPELIQAYKDTFWFIREREQGR